MRTAAPSARLARRATARVTKEKEQIPVAQNPNWGPAGSGGFLRILGIIYLIKIIRQRRMQRRPGAEGGPAED